MRAAALRPLSGLGLALLLGGASVRAQSPEAEAAKLTRLRSESKEVAEGLRRVDLDGLKPQEAAQRIKGAVEKLKAKDGRSPELRAVLDHLEGLAADWPGRKYCAESPQQMLLALARQIEFSAAKSSKPGELAGTVKTDLILPTDAQVASEPESLFPTHLTLKRYKTLGPIIVFLMKHRMGTPQDGYKPMDVDDIFKRQDADDMVAVTGVVLKGKVTHVSNAVDQDLCFDVGVPGRDIEVEITPGWRLLHHVDFPKVGDSVEVFGWSYWDMFHQDELAGEHEEDEKGKRATVWEVHPAHVVNILPK